MSMHPELRACYLCGGDDTVINENRTAPTMSRPEGQLISVEIRHWCERNWANDEFVTMSVTLRARDLQQAIECWNYRNE